MTAIPAQEMRAIFRKQQLYEEFRRKGYVVVPFLKDDAADRLLDVWRESGVPLHSMPFSASVMSGDREYRRSVSDEIAHVFSEGIRELLLDYRFSFGNFIAKRASAMDGIPLHQDAMFVDEHRFESINLWVPLVDVTPENGCLRVMPGSHTLNAALRGTNRRFPYPQFEAYIERNFLLDVPMQRGWACMMSQRTFHTSYPNASGDDRICASALAVPEESDVYYLYQQPGEPDAQIELYAADDEFYRYQVFGAAAEGRKLLGR
ncbi:MAG: phytanoyl-CoA dioxygenase family protein, partial [Vulcanimicrobiaceae bacterium]